MACAILEERFDARTKRIVFGARCRLAWCVLLAVLSRACVSVEFCPRVRGRRREFVFAGRPIWLYFWIWVANACVIFR
jgi:hypothetical protein